MKPRRRASSWLKRSLTKPITTSSGTRSPASMNVRALAPNSEPERTAARNMSPVETCGTA